MGMNCAPLLADLFLCSYEVEFIQKLREEKKKSLAVAFNLTFRHIDNVLPINNDQLHSYVDLIYPNKAKVMFFSFLRLRACRFSQPFSTKQTMSFSYNHNLIADIFLTYFFSNCLKV
jgi:hypothetical protein